MRLRLPRAYIAITGVLAVLVLVTGPATAGPFAVSPITLASGPSPFAACTAGFGGQPPIINYVNVGSRVRSSRRLVQASGVRVNDMVG